jgi:predicted dehydrogenase
VTTGPLRVGVAGAGPWSLLFHAPMLASHPATTLAAVWARRLPAAEAIAGPYGAAAHDSFDRFLDDVDAVAFAVPPDVQPALATRAAKAGKALLLEKPLALNLADAEGLAGVVEQTEVATQMVVTWRYVPKIRSLLEAVAQTTPIGGRSWFLSGGFLGGMFATPWRLEHGPLFDLGPHVVDLLDAALGTVIGIRAHGDRHGWVGLLLEHEGGAVSEASLTGTSPVEPARAGVEIHTSDGLLEVALISHSASAATTIVDEFVATVGTRTPHPLDVRRGVHLQRLLTAAARDLA